MSLVNVLNLSHTFLGKTLFSEIGFQVEAGDRVGLVGPNGSGKTTLLRLLTNEISPDSGEIRMAQGTRIGYLAQDVHETLSGTLLQSVLDSIPGRLSLRDEITKFEERLKDRQQEREHEELATRLAEIHQEMTDLDRRFPPHRAEKILLGLGFRPDDFNTSISSLSGGWKMRGVLGSLLYQSPDLLLLDEPTNHLDLISSEILIDALDDFKGTLLFVSHNQSFINRLATKIWDIREGSIWEYPGTLYEYYEHLSRSDIDPLTVTRLDKEDRKAQVEESIQKNGVSQKMKRRQKADRRRLISTTLKPIQDELLQLEEGIAKLESREKELETILAEPQIIRDKSQYLPRLNEHGDVKKTLEELMLRWEHKQKELGSAKRDLGM